MSPSPENIYDLTKQRLNAYGIFTKATVEIVARLAQKQSSYTTYQEFFTSIHLPSPYLFVNEKGEGVSVVAIAAQNKQKGAIVLHLPMSNPLDANQLYHVATVAATNPSYRVIAFGNPSGEPFSFKEQNLTFWKRVSIGTLRNLYPLVSAESDYLNQQRLSTIHHVGYSFGAHKALIEASYAKPGLIRSLTLIDPVAHPRGIKQLIEDFKRTFEPMGVYVNRTKIQSYFDARKKAGETHHHKQALKRPINSAIGFMMARFDFIPMVKKILAEQSTLDVTVAWGSKSELGNDAHISTSLNKLKLDTSGRVHTMRLKDDKHALANDIHLYAAIIRETIASTEK